MLGRAMQTMEKGTERMRQPVTTAIAITKNLNPTNNAKECYCKNWQENSEIRLNFGMSCNLKNQSETRKFGFFYNYQTILLVKFYMI